MFKMTTLNILYLHPQDALITTITILPRIQQIMLSKWPAATSGLLSLLRGLEK